MTVFLDKFKTLLLLTVIVLLSYAVWELNEVTEMLEMININSIEMPKVLEEIRG